MLCYHEAMKKLWFRVKRYGWGWYPVTWEGWSITLVYAVLLGVSVGRVSNYAIGHSVESASSLIVPVTLHLLWIAFLIGTLLFICVKTGEKPEWNWGDKD